MCSTYTDIRNTIAKSMKDWVLDYLEPDDLLSNSLFSFRTELLKIVVLLLDKKYLTNVKSENLSSKRF
jgi:hypothetical protein